MLLRVFRQSAMDPDLEAGIMELIRTVEADCWEEPESRPEMGQDIMAEEDSAVGEAQTEKQEAQTEGMGWVPAEVLEQTTGQPQHHGPTVPANIMEQETAV